MLRTLLLTFERMRAKGCNVRRVGTPQSLASSRQLPFQGRQDKKPSPCRQRRRGASFAWRLTLASRRFTPKAPVRLHKPRLQHNAAGSHLLKRIPHGTRRIAFAQMTMKYHHEKKHPKWSAFPICLNTISRRPVCDDLPSRDGAFLRLLLRE